jgi:hypothetical protein
MVEEVGALMTMKLPSQVLPVDPVTVIRVRPGRILRSPWSEAKMMVLSEQPVMTRFEQLPFSAA